MCDDMRIVESLPTNVKTIFIHHELRFIRDELWASTISNLSDKDKNQICINKRDEIRLLNQYGAVVTLSSIDTQKLKCAGVKSPICTSLAIVNDSKQRITQNVTFRKVLSYIGPQLHIPNYEGVMWFLSECWWKIRNVDPDYTLQIIGNWNKDTIEKIQTTYSGVKCLGFVEDLEQAIVGTTMIVPLHIGSGIRMKILEAARLGVPVVSTTVGVEGLPLKNGKHLFIADNPDLFIEDIFKLQDSTLRELFINNMHDVISSNYTMQSLRENRVTLYE